MKYLLSDLLCQLGRYEDIDKNQPSRHTYNNVEQRGVGGFSEIRMDEDHNVLVAELRHWKPGDTPNGLGNVNIRRVETVYMEAERIGQSAQFCITHFSIDGQTVDVEQDTLVEYGLSLFQERTEEIKTCVKEQAIQATLNRAAKICDILPPTDEPVNQVHTAESIRERFKKFQESNRSEDICGMIIRFKPKPDAPIQPI